MAQKQWLTLREAANILGVHPATLRTWADAGIIPSFRTPGGHRRFALEDLESFIRTHSQGSIALPAHTTSRIIHTALEYTRRELPQARTGAAWYEAFDEETRRRKRQEGRLLFSLALQYVSKPEERQRILARARKLGQRYGEDSVRFNISLVETLRAIFFFRQMLVQTLEAEGDLVNGQSPADYRVTRGVDEFITEVILSVVDAYERTLRSHLLEGA